MAATKLIFKIILTMGLITSHGFFSEAKTENNKKVIIAVLDDGQEHEKELLSALKDLIKDCNSCEIRSYPIYKTNGDLTATQFISSLKKAEKEANILNFSWNIASDKNTKEIEQALEETAKRKLIFAAAGAPEGANLRAPLSNTIIGKTPNIFIVGELNPRGTLHMHSYEGPEMYTALTPTKGKTGSSFSVLKLTAAVAKKISGGISPEQIRKDLVERKAQTLKELEIK